MFTVAWNRHLKKKLMFFFCNNYFVQTKTWIISLTRPQKWNYFFDQTTNVTISLTRRQFVVVWAKRFFSFLCPDHERNNLFVVQTKRNGLWNWIFFSNCGLKPPYIYIGSILVFFFHWPTPQKWLATNWPC